MPRKIHIPERDFAFADESFTLVIEPTADGERLTAEQQQREQDRAEAAKNQPELLN